MASEQRYREVLYRDYFETQAGRSGKGGLTGKTDADKAQLAHDVLPLMPGSREARILDIGCGYGSLLLLLQEKGYTQLHGIDLSADQVAQAKALGLDNVVQADLFPYLQAQPQSFDVITGIDLIEHFGKNELVDVLAAVKEALRPGGSCIFRTPNMDAPFASTYAYGDYTHESFFNKHSADQLMKAAGFSKVEVLPSVIAVDGAVKKILQRVSWAFLSAACKWALFASGKSTSSAYFTPNLLIRAWK